MSNHSSRRAISATVTVAPILKTSARGSSYCSIGVVDSKGQPVACMAYDSLAELIADMAQVGFAINLFGYEKEGVFTVTGFDIPKVGKVEPAKNYKTKPPEPMIVDGLMDVLGAKYVHDRIWAWRGTKSLTKLVRNFDLEGWKGLIDELTIEAELKRAADDGKDTQAF